MDKIKIFFCLLLGLVSWQTLSAQRNKPIDIARHFQANGQADSALIFYKMAYDEAPFDLKVYEEYFGYLMQLKKYDTAEALATYMMEVKRKDPAIVMDLAQVYEAKGEKKKQKKLIEQLFEGVENLSDYDIKKIGNTFYAKGQLNNAILLYEKVSQNPAKAYHYKMDLMNLYLENGDIEKVLPIYYELYPYMSGIEKDIQSKMLVLIEKEPSYKEKIKNSLQKLSKKSKEFKDTYASLLAWLEQEDGNYEQALSGLIQQDKKQSGSLSKNIFEIGNQALENRQYATARQAFEYLYQSESENHFQHLAGEKLLKTYYLQLSTTRPVQPAMVTTTKNMMESYFAKHPEQQTSISYLWYMDVLGKYAQQPQLAITMLESLLDKARLSKEYIGMAKLAIGDYQLSMGNIWDANLTYAQVDKAYKQDAMGEEARFKQAKLAFYRGDFEWAQTMLNVLKASTTELISNDAMSLSILITENTVKDTSAVPLKMYAQADLLISQYQYQTADSLLQQLLDSFPQSDLTDDVYMLRANLAKEEGRMSTALNYYEMVATKFKADVLADDALLQCGMIYEIHLAEPDKAKKYYEDLILSFPNSTLSPIARERLEKLKNKGNKL